MADSARHRRAAHAVANRAAQTSAFRNLIIHRAPTAVAAKGANGRFRGLLLPVTEYRFEVPPGVENTFDKDGGVRDDKRDGGAPLESGHGQSGQHVVALCSPQGNVVRPLQNATMRST